MPFYCYFRNKRSISIIAHSLSPSFEKRRNAAVAMINNSSLPIFCKLNASFLNIFENTLENKGVFSVADVSTDFSSFSASEVCTSSSFSHGFLTVLSLRSGGSIMSFSDFCPSDVPPYFFGDDYISGAVVICSRIHRLPP